MLLADLLRYSNADKPEMRELSPSEMFSQMALSAAPILAFAIDGNLSVEQDSILWFWFLYSFIFKLQTSG
jgi:hypothetical protein